jgi:hypothetical protein
MGDVLSTEPALSALNDKYAPDKMYITGDRNFVHTHAPYATYPSDYEFNYDLEFKFPSVSCISSREYAKLERMPLVDQGAVSVGVSLKRRTPDLYLSEHELAGGETALDKLGIGGRPHLRVVICSDACNDRRRDWPDEYYRKFIEMLKADYRVTVLDIGAAMNNSNLGDVSIRGVSLRHATAIMSHCDYFVGTNRGAFQLAQMANLPSIIIFTLVPPRRAVHDDKICYPVCPEIGCRFCQWKDMEATNRDGGCYQSEKKCMLEITPEMVYEKFRVAHLDPERKLA